jgi:transcriptional regulator with XRE-family HTH domain
VSSSGFAEYLIELRRRRRLLQKQVASSAGFDPSYIAGLEKGRRAPPRRELLDRLLVALNANAAEQQKLLATAAADRLSHVIARHRQSIEGADVLARIASWLPEIQPDDLITLERVAMGFTSRGEETRQARREPPRKEKTA